VGQSRYRDAELPAVHDRRTFCRTFQIPNLLGSPPRVHGAPPDAGLQGRTKSEHRCVAWPSSGDEGYKELEEAVVNVHRLIRCRTSYEGHSERSKNIPIVKFRVISDFPYISPVQISLLSTSSPHRACCLNILPTMNWKSSSSVLFFTVNTTRR